LGKSEKNKTDKEPYGKPSGSLLERKFIILAGSRPPINQIRSVQESDLISFELEVVYFGH